MKQIMLLAVTALSWIVFAEESSIASSPGLVIGEATKSWLNQTPILLMQQPIYTAPPPEKNKTGPGHVLSQFAIFLMDNHLLGIAFIIASCVMARSPDWSGWPALILAALGGIVVGMEWIGAPSTEVALERPTWFGLSSETIRTEQFSILKLLGYAVIPFSAIMLCRAIAKLGKSN